MQLMAVFIITVVEQIRMASVYNSHLLKILLRVTIQCDWITCYFCIAIYKDDWGPSQ